MMRTAPPIEAQHPLRSDVVLDKLANSEEFRARLNFEMDDHDVIQDGNRNTNFIPVIPNLSSPIRLFQNDKITSTQNDIILKTRFLFTIHSKSIKIKSIRTISPNPNGTSHSIIRSEIRNAELLNNINDIASKTLSYIMDRHKKENKLLSRLTASSEIAIASNFTIPFDNIFAEVQSSIVQLDHLLAQESAIDPSILNASNELRELHKEVNESAVKIMNALQVRDNLQRDIKRQSAEVANAAAQIEQILIDPDRSPTVPDTKNDVAFVFSLVPLLVAVAGYVLKKNK